jgi:hypothetical protein
MFQPHHLNSHLQSERDLLDKLARIRPTASLDKVVNPASAKFGVDEKVLSVEVQHLDPAPIEDDRTRPFGRWYVTILAVVAFGAAVAALSYAFVSSEKTLASMANR